LALLILFGEVHRAGRKSLAGRICPARGSLHMPGVVGQYSSTRLADAIVWKKNYLRFLSGSL